MPVAEDSRLLPTTFTLFNGSLMLQSKSPDQSGPCEHSMTERALASRVTSIWKVCRFAVAELMRMSMSWNDPWQYGHSEQALEAKSEHE